MKLMKEKKTAELLNQLMKLTYKFNELEKNPLDFGTGEVLYPSEIHTIDAVGNRFDTVTAISTEFGITKGAVSQVIIKLCKKGYIEKRRNKEYSKEILLSLTDKGVNAYNGHKRLHEIMDTGLQDLIDSYPEEWILTFQKMLVQVENEVDQLLKLGKERKIQ